MSRLVVLIAVVASLSLFAPVAAQDAAPAHPETETIPIVLGAATDLGTLGGQSSRADAINAAGQIVGSARTADGPLHAALWEGGRVTDLGILPGGSISFARDINDAGQVVGTADAADGHYHAVLWEGGRITDLGTLPGGTVSYAHAVNAAGQVVGQADTPDGDLHAALWAPV